MIELSSQKKLKLLLQKICMFFVAGIVVTACEKQNQPTPVESESLSESSTPLIEPEAVEAVEKIWPNADAEFQRLIEHSQALRQNINNFLTSPNAETLESSRSSWHTAHNQFQQLSIYLTIAESNPGLFDALSSHRYQLDAHPIQPGFIDYFDVYQQSGIVNDMAMELSAQSLRQQHGITDESDVSLGFHALEYILWGENGERPVDDFVSLSTLTAEQNQLGLKPVDLPNNRRRVYLQLLAELIVDDATALHNEWSNPISPIKVNYQPLQTGSRMQLWQNAIAILVNELELLNEDLNQINSEENQAEEASDFPGEDESEIIAHNQFAQGDSQIIAAKITGLADLLFHDFVAESETAETTSDDLANWIFYNKNSTTFSDATENTTSENEQDAATTVATITATNEADLKLVFQTVLQAFDSDPSLSLSESQQQALTEFIATIRARLSEE